MVKKIFLIISESNQRLFWDCLDFKNFDKFNY